jgi:hypothetical protein
MNYNFISCIVVVALVIMTCSVSFSILEEKRLEALSNALSEASIKGINPIAVRCAFAKSADTICIVYASKNRDIEK